MINSFAWFVWLASAVVAISSTRNPLYLFLMQAAFGLVVEVLWKPDSPRPVMISPWRFTLFVVPSAAFFNMLTSHFGETVLFSLPSNIPLLGGIITAEAMVYGAINGLILSALFTAFIVLNLAVPVRDLIRLVPRAFYPIAVVISIAVTFVPTTLRQINRIREAQAVRGHRMRGIRDWLPLFMPLLVGGLERALQLAESMTARGFASFQTERSRVVRWQVGSLISLCLVLLGIVWRVVSPTSPWGMVAIFSGLAVLGWVLWLAGRGTGNTTYRSLHWTRYDFIISLSALLALLVFLMLGRSSRVYESYPALTLPIFDPFVGIAILGFIVPVLFADQWRSQAAADVEVTGK